MDVTLLKLMRNKTNFRKIQPNLRAGTLSDKTMFMLKEYHHFFTQFKEVEDITPEAWTTWFETFRHKDLGAEEKAAYRAMMVEAFKPLDPAIADGMLQKVAELNLATKMANIANAYDAGEEIDIRSEFQHHFDQFKLDTGAADEVGNWIQEDISDLMAEEERDDGIKWRLDCVNWCMRPLRSGDFGLVAGRPDKGKTTLLASEVTHWATQIPDNRPIVWLNNEGPGRRIVPRLYQSALGITMPEMMKMNQEGTLAKAYKEAIGGDISKIRIIDIHGYNTGQVQQIIEKHEPSIIIADMIDHVRSPSGAAAKHESLEELYKWFRERAVLDDAITVATSQISVDGDGELFPLQHMLKDSKTGKQGTLDWQLMMGASNDPGLEGIRGIGLVKNKLAKAGRPTSPNEQVTFKPQIARLECSKETS